MTTEPRRMIFVADVHLEPGGGPHTDRFAAFLREFCSAGDELFILGDLFDLWLGRGHERCADYSTALAEITRATSSGVGVNILPGNRDFLIDPSLELTTGATVLPEEHEITIGESRALLCHGDQFCTGDVAYQRMRRWLRSWPVRLIARLPMFIRRRLAASIRGKAVKELASKDDALMGIVEQELRLRIAGGVDVIVCGHVHRKHEIEVAGGRVFVLGCWGDTHEALVHAAGQWQWRAVMAGEDR